MTTAVREAPHHRNTTCYTDYKCRLPECVDRYNALNRERLQAKKNGTWKTFVDAGIIREHLLKLQAEDVTPCLVAYETGLPKQTIIDFLVPNHARGRGRRQRTSPEIAQKILAVTADCLGGKVPSAGARRRTGALMAAGWPANHISARAGLHRRTVGHVMHREVIYASTAIAISDTFDALRNLKPTRHGVVQGQATRAKGWASQHGFPTIAYWADRMDDIDDPHFEPMYGITRRLIVAQDANELMRGSGLNKTAAADRLGISVAYIDHAFRDHPEYAVEAAA